MLPFLEFPVGVHSAPRAALRFHLHSALALPSGSHLNLKGNNGVGKSTFLEEILIPSLRLKHSILYLAQDMDLQRTTMAVTLALLGHEVPTSLPDLALAWIKVSHCQDVLILDEFDKYLSVTQYAALNIQSFSWVISISHLALPQSSSQLPHGFELTLHRDPNQPEVNMSLERLW